MNAPSLALGLLSQYNCPRSRPRLLVAVRRPPTPRSQIRGGPTIPPTVLLIFLHLVSIVVKTMRSAGSEALF